MNEFFDLNGDDCTDPGKQYSDPGFLDELEQEPEEEEQEFDLLDFYADGGGLF